MRLATAGLPLLCCALSPLRPAPHARHAAPRLLEPPFELPYEVPEMPKPFADYEWDPNFPGTFKPGTRGENQDLEQVLKDWEGRDNPACMELPQDELWQVPLAPPEDILSWLSRVGLLAEEETAAGDDEESFGSKGDSLLDDEFDLSDEVSGSGLGTRCGWPHTDDDTHRRVRCVRAWQVDPNAADLVPGGEGGGIDQADF